MASDDFNVLDFNSARRYPGGINKYLFEFINYVNEHGGGGGDVDDIDYNKIKNLPQFIYPSIRDSITLAGQKSLADYFIESLDNKIREISLTPDYEKDIREYASVHAVKTYVSATAGDSIDKIESEMEHHANKQTTMDDTESTEDIVHYPSVKAVRGYVKEQLAVKEDVANKVEVISHDKSSDEDKNNYLSVFAYKKDITERLKDLDNLLVLDKDLPVPKVFVSEIGDDNNTGMSPSSPLRTITKALEYTETDLPVFFNYNGDNHYNVENEIKIDYGLNLIATSANNHVIVANSNDDLFYLGPGQRLDLYNLTFRRYFPIGPPYEDITVKSLQIVNESAEYLKVDFDYIKSKISSAVSLHANLDEIGNKYSEYLFIDGKYEKVGVDDYNDLDNRVRLDGKLLSSNSTLEELNIQPKLVSDDSEGKQNLKTVNGEVLTGKGNIVISGGGEASTYASLPDKPELEGHVLNSGNNTLEDLGIAGANDLSNLDGEVNILAGELNIAKNDIVLVRNNIATSFDKTSNTTSPSCKAIADYIDTVLAGLDGSNVRF